MAEMSDAEVAPVAVAPADEDVPQNLMDALKNVLKRARIHDGLAAGLHQAAKVLDRRAAHLCVLAEDCDLPEYSRLVEALCREHGIDLIKVPEKKKLGEWVGLATYQKTGELKKVVGCSCCVVKDYGEKSKSLDMILEHFKKE
eukprot:RCo038419